MNIRHDANHVVHALTKEQYDERVAELGRPLNWPRAWYHKQDQKIDKVKSIELTMEAFG